MRRSGGSTSFDPVGSGCREAYGTASIGSGTHKTAAIAGAIVLLVLGLVVISGLIIEGRA